MEPTTQTQAEPYTLSWPRIAERVITGVLVAVLTVVCLAILSPIPAALGLLFQAVSHYIVVPPHILVAIVFVGVGMLLAVLILALLGYLALRKLPPMALFGALLGAAIFSGLYKKALETFSRAAPSPKPNAPSQPDPGRAASAPTPNDLRDMFDRVRAGASVEKQAPQP